MSQTVRITYYGMEGAGRTVTEAKRDAGAKVERFIKEAQESQRGFLGQYFCGIERGYHGWEYWFFAPGDEQSAFGQCRFRVGVYATRQDAERALRGHVAQIQPTVEEAWALCMDERQQRDIADYFAWQAAYKDAAGQGMTDTEAREFASRYRDDYRTLPDVA